MRIFCSHHKCATKWFLKLFTYFSNATGSKLEQFHDSAAGNPEIERIVRDRSAGILFLSNANYEYIQSCEDKVVHMVRDPRDIIVSGYFSHRYSHETTYWPELASHRELLNQCSQEDGLMHEIDFSGQFLAPMKNWPVGDARILTVKFEEFSVDPVGVCLRIFRFLGMVHERRKFYDSMLELTMRLISLQRRKGLYLLPGNIRTRSICRQNLESFVDSHSFQRITERKPGEEDVMSHYRRGTPGDGKRYLSDEHLLYVNSKYSDILELYAYK